MSKRKKKLTPRDSGSRISIFSRRNEHFVTTCTITRHLVLEINSQTDLDFFLSGFGWHLPGLSQVNTRTPPPSSTCWTFPASLCFRHFFCTFVFSFFPFLFFLILCCSVFVYTLNPTANINDDFFQVRLTLSPVTFRRPDYTIFSVDIGVTDVTKNSRLFAVTSTTCSTLLKLLLIVAVFSPPIDIKQALVQHTHSSSVRADSSSSDKSSVRE